jgi:thiol-disulfide isomerase/thioredoxin
MLTVNLGPFAIPISQWVLMIALLVALGVGYLVGRRQQTGGIGHVLSDMLIVALLVARIAFVAIWFDTYRNSPWSMLDIRDGGLTPWAGVAAALLVAIWRGWRGPALRKPLILGLAAGVLAWGAMSGVLRMLERPILPKMSLTTLAGKSTDLAAQAAGKPMVVNLWATWCPPCRREMPVLAAAQQQETGVSFIFANQGEDGATVQHYLSTNRLDLANVLLDPAARLGPEVGSMGLPTTLFYDANGRLVDTQVGGLSPASLASKLMRLRTPSDLSTKE